MEIFVYKGEYGLPSIDFDCIRILTLIKITKAPVQIRFDGSPFRSPSGLFPYLKTDDGRTLAGYKDIADHLTTLGYRPNGDSEKASEIAGYIEYMRENLQPYFLYSLWGTERNQDKTRTLYAKRIPFPWNFYTPKKYIERAEEIMRSFYSFSMQEPEMLHDTGDMALRAKKCLNSMEESLAGKMWFVQNQPSEVDAHIYAYCSVLLHHTMPNNALQAHIQNCPNLVKFVGHVTKTLFAAEGFSSQKQDASNTEEKRYYSGQEDEEDLWSKRRRQIVSAVVATVAMVTYQVTYAVFKGILHIPSEERREAEFYDYDDMDEIGDDGGGGHHEQGEHE